MRAFLRRARFSLIMLIFFILLSLTITSFALDNFTKEENIKQFVIETTLTQLKNTSDIDRLYDYNFQMCKKGALNQDIPFGDGNKTLSCDDILKTAKEDYTDLIITKFVFEPMYYKNYPCTFLQCVMHKETMPIILSEQGRHFINSIKIFLILGTIITGLLVGILSNSFGLAFKSIGYTLAVVGAGYTFLNHIPYSKMSFGVDAATTARTATAVFGPIRTVALIIFIVGIVLWLTGMIINFIQGKGLIARLCHRTEKIPSNKQ